MRAYLEVSNYFYNIVIPFLLSCNLSDSLFRATEVILDDHAVI